MSREVIVVVGQGRVGQSLARALEHVVESVISLPARGITSNHHPTEVLGRASTIVLAVRDAAIDEVATAISTRGVGAGQVVLHTSGLRTSASLEPLRPGGAALGSLHPLMTFGETPNSATLFEGTPAIVEGDPPAVAAARVMAGLLGMTPVIELPAESKACYHAAAVFASNYLVVLAGIAERLAHEAGIENPTGLFYPLMLQTLRNQSDGSVASALTGPIARGDVATVTANLAVLNGELADLYRRLGLEAVKLSELEDDAAAAMRAALGHPDQRTEGRSRESA
jgi:predicted short-subunit dehydrogenase-like oxidoreductase (DUF2520 family)